MSAFYLALIITFWSTSIWGLQVTPNSGCSSACMDDPTQDPSDPNVSNTYGSDIVCLNDDYTFTATGQKFETCLNCLQNSTAVGSGENDLAWYLFNLRFALTTCVFGAAKAIDPVTIPCSLSTACGPIEGALLDGMSDPSTLQQYGYCSAFVDSFAGPFFHTCSKCLLETVEESMFSNFLTALQAGCLQQPAPGHLLGLNGTVFTTDEVQIITPTISTGNKSHKIMTPGVIVGIAAGGIVLILIIISIIFICHRKRSKAKVLKKLHSPLDSRFGAKNITAPHRGDYSSPKNSPPFSKEDVPMKVKKPSETKSLALNFSRRSIQRAAGNQDPGEQRQPIRGTPNPPSYSSPQLPQRRESIIPTHHAYIPPPYRPDSWNSIAPASYSPLPPPQPRQPPPASYPQRSTSASRSSISPQPPAASPSQRPPSANRMRSPTPVQPIVTRQQSNVSGASRIYTRDLSMGRGSTLNTAQNPVQNISGPRVRVGSRFESEDEARLARERLYKVGFVSGTIAHDPKSKEMPESVSPESVASREDMWPGNY